MTKGHHEGEHRAVDGDWVARLPSLEGLFASQTASLIRGFSLLSLPLFRRHKASSATNALETLRAASVYTVTDDNIDVETATKALTSLQAFISDTKSSKTQLVDGGRETDILYEMYLRGFYIASMADGSKEDEAKDLQEAARQCLVGYLALEPHVTENKWMSMISQVTGSIFGPPSSSAYLLTPIFELPRRVTTQLQEHHVQRVGKKGPTSAGGSEDPVEDKESLAIHLLDLLDIFRRHVETYDILPGSTKVGQKQIKAKTKADAEEDKSRPKRVALEAHIVACELATALASMDIAEVKDRARGGPGLGVPDLISDNGSSGGEEGDDEAENFKPDLGRRAAASGTSLRPTSVPREDPNLSKSAGMAWDDHAETTLLCCLQSATSLVENRQLSVLTRIVHPADWLDQANTMAGSSSKAGPSRTTDSETDSDSGMDSDSDSDDEDPSSTNAGSTPLRTIFRLQDRYEELRLAVWLSLPPDSRGKMSAYMRGIPTMNQVMAMKDSDMDEEDFKDKIKGRIGEAWDRLGLALLKRCDGRELERHGLDTEKLDKWEELISVKSSKKAKRGRITI